MPDFFISYRSLDKAWAEWIGWQLETGGYSVWLYDWDVSPGQDWPLATATALSTASHVLVVLSPAYLSGQFTKVEWGSAMARDPDGDWGLMLAVRVVSCEPPGYLGQMPCIDCMDVDEPTATERLRSLVRQHVLAAAGHTEVAPATARTAAPAFPGLPIASSRAAVPQRDPNFLGREEELATLARYFQEAPSVLLTGPLGIGKTSLAIEYAHLPDGRSPVYWTQYEVSSLIHSWLTSQGGWLLIVDDVITKDQQMLCELAAKQDGRVLMTSSDQTNIADRTVHVKPLAKEHAARLLLNISGQTDLTSAYALSDALGGIPSSLVHIAQAARFLNEPLSRIKLPLAQSERLADLDVLLSAKERWQEVLHTHLILSHPHLNLSHPSTKAFLHFLIGSTLRVLGDAERGLMYLQQALDGLELDDMPTTWRVEVSRSLGLIHYSQGDLKEASKALSWAATEAAQTYGPTADRTYHVLADLGRALRRMGDVPAAITTLEHVLAGVRARQPVDQRQLARALFELGRVYVDDGRWYDGMGLLIESRALYRTMSGQRALNGRVDTILHIARAHHLLGNLDQARIHYRDALRIAESTGNRFGMAAARLGLGRLRIKMGLYGDALEDLTSARQIYTDLKDSKRAADAQEILDAIQRLRDRKAG